MSGALSQLAETLTPIGWGAVGLVFAGWLAVSFLPAGRARALLESLSATGIFAALLSLFVNLVDDAVRDGSVVRSAAFGLLMALFSCGFVLSCVQTAQLARGRESGASSATN